MSEEKLKEVAKRMHDYMENKSNLSPEQWWETLAQFVVDDVYKPINKEYIDQIKKD